MFGIFKHNFMKLNKKNSRCLLGMILLVNIFLANSAFAKTIKEGMEETGGKAGYTAKTSFQEILGQLIGGGSTIGGIFAIAGALFLGFLVYGGFMILTSAGDKDQVAKGKKILLWTIIGAVVMAAALAISNLVFNILITQK